MISSKDVLKEDLKVLGPKFSKFIKELRSQLKLTQKDLSLKSKISLYQIKQIENGKRFISIKEAKLLAKIFKTSPIKIISCEL